ncbi:MAG: aspartyl protease family protein [Candidatus Rokuibacteriota bacterium]
MVRAAVVLLAVLLMDAGVALPAAAQIYRWTDERGNAHYTEGLANVPERVRSRAVPLGLRNDPSTPTAAPAGSPPGETVIRFLPGRHIVVSARVNGSASCRLILDTGAGGTLISPRVLAAAGVSLTRGVRSARTRGIAKDVEVEVQQVVVDSIEVGDARVERLVVSAYDMEMPDVDGLLGQDFLTRFNVSIDPGAGIVKLGAK